MTNLPPPFRGDSTCPTMLKLSNPAMEVLLQLAVLLPCCKEFQSPCTPNTDLAPQELALALIETSETLQRISVSINPSCQCGAPRDDTAPP